MANNDRQITEEDRNLARANFASRYIMDAATGAYASKEEYGTLADSIYAASLERTPDQHGYDQLILPNLMSDEGGLNKAGFKRQALGILGGSFSLLPSEEAFSMLGLEGTLKGDFAGKNFADLDKKDQSAVIGTFLGNRADTTLRNKVVPMRIRARNQAAFEKFYEPSQKE